MVWFPGGPNQQHRNSPDEDVLVTAKPKLSLIVYMHALLGPGNGILATGPKKKSG